MELSHILTGGIRIVIPEAWCSEKWGDVLSGRRVAILTFILTSVYTDAGHAMECLILLRNYGFGAGEGNRTLVIIPETS
jgi:hypothetical protein